MRLRAATRGRRAPRAAAAGFAVATGCCLALAVAGVASRGEDVGAAASASAPLDQDPVASARAGRSRALIAFLPTKPVPEMPLLFQLGERRGFAVGLTSPTVGGYSRAQMALDMSQGSRVVGRAYPRPLAPLELVPDGDRGRLEGWSAARRRAAGALGDVRPGLLASTAKRSGAEVAYAGVVGLEHVEAAVAADARGRIDRLSLGTVGTLGERALDLWGRSDLLVTRLPEDERGLDVLDELIAARGEGDLLYVVRAPPRAYRMLPSGVAGPGYGGVLRSGTTRRNGIIAATDVAPTVLRQLGSAVPPAMSGEPIESRPRGSASDVLALSGRMNVIIPRREAALRFTFLGWLALVAGLAIARRADGVRAACRIALLGGLWLPGLALLTAALTPTLEVELAVLTIGGLVLGALTDRLVRWPAAPAVPAALVLVAHTIDLAAGSGLIARSLAGPNPLGGARFYGLGNELETILAVSVLIGTGAALTIPRAAAARWGPRAFALACLAAAVVVGAGRLGAAVGGVITLAAGGAGAVLACLPGGVSRRRVAIAAAAPVAGLAALALIDVATGGEAHFTRSVLDADEPGALPEIIERRLDLSLAGLTTGTTPFSVTAAAILLIAGVAKRRALLAPLDDLPPPPARAFRAGLAGALVATIVGALANDSGPVIFLIGSGALVLTTGYVAGRPRLRASEPGAADDSFAPSVAGASSRMPRCA